MLKNPAMRGGPFATALAFNAGRKEHADSVLLPAKARGDVVIFDRYYPSTDIFQIELGSGMSAQEAGFLHMLHRSFPQPDLTVFILPDKELHMARMANAGVEPDAFEGDLREVAAYEAYAANYSKAAKSLILRPSLADQSMAVGVGEIVRMGLEG